MLAEDLIAEIKEPLSGMRQVSEAIFNKISDNWTLFKNPELQKEGNDLLGLCTMLFLSHQHLQNVLDNYQKKINDEISNKKNRE